MKGFIEWKNRLDEMVEEGITLTSLEKALWDDLQEHMQKYHLYLIECRDEGDGIGKAAFIREVGEFLSSHEVTEMKFQRNLFFDIAGSDPTEPKPRKLVQEYVAFLVWR